MEIFDIVLAALLIFGFIRGLIKGLFVEVASLVSLIGGIYGAIHFSSYAGNILSNYVDWEEKYISLTAFAITFFIIVLLIALLGKIFTKLASFAALGIINKILGGVFGALKIGLIVSVILTFFAKMNNTLPLPFVQQETLEKSILYKPVKNLAPMIFPSIIKRNEDQPTQETDA